MIVSHKHKFIFVKTHKTSTQTFMKFIKPHLGPDDIMAGDGSSIVNDNTKLNVDTVFESTGKSPLEYQEKYGNHLPWFIIKEIVGDDMWDEYTTFTIERPAKDRLVSLFCFLNPILINPGHFLPSEAKRSALKGPEIRDMQSKSLLELYPDQVREYFEDITLLQLLAERQPVTQHDTYGVDSLPREREIYKQCAQKHNLMKIFDIDKEPTAFTTRGDVDQIVHSYLPDDVWIRAEPYRKHQNTEGQCRFLNYGYYHDGSRNQVDNVIQFNNVGDNIDRFFQNFKINIDCDNETYDMNSQNVHYRKNQKMLPMEWWYQGKKQVDIRRAVDECFDKYL
jgi:hypothetical protein